MEKKKGVLPDIISAGDEYLRARLISTGLLHDIIKEAEVPVVAPSANLSGSLTGTKAIPYFSPAVRLNSRKISSTSSVVFISVHSLSLTKLIN